MTEVETTVVEKKKSIVPARYAGKYKPGGNDELAVFINEQCKDDKGVFDYAKFFDLCVLNGIEKAKVDHYHAQVFDEKRMGSQGRARMTLRNVLAAKARASGKLVDLDGNEVDINLPKVALAGAVAAAAAKKAGETQETVDSH